MKSSLHSPIHFLPFPLSDLRLDLPNSTQFLTATRSNELFFNWTLSTSDNSQRHRWLDYWTLLYNHFAQTMQKTQSLLLRMRFYCSVAQQWTSYCCALWFPWECFRSRCLAMGLYVTIYIYIYIYIFVTKCLKAEQWNRIRGWFPR
jgi:hypothetical protein